MDVEKVLKNYRQLKREIEVKKELLHLEACQFKDEVIEEMNFKSFPREGSRGNKTADKTGNIALGYEVVMEERHRVQVEQLRLDIRELELEVFKVEKVVEALEEKQQRVIKGLYFQGKSRRQLCRELYISDGTLSRWRRKSVDNICKFIIPR